MSRVWMSGPRKAVARGAYTNGPSPYKHIVQAQMNDADILVCKTIRTGEVVGAWDGADDLKPYSGKVE